MRTITLTANATLDNLSDAAYWEIYGELRGYSELGGTYAFSLDKFIARIGGVVSKAMWSKYHTSQLKILAGEVDEHGDPIELVLSRHMRNELRAAVGMALLPPTVEEATKGVDPDASVIQVGDETPDCVLLIGTREDLKITLINGSVSACPVTAVTLIVTGSLRPRRQLIRPVASQAQKKKVEALGVSWREVIDAGIIYINQQRSEKGDVA